MVLVVVMVCCDGAGDDVACSGDGKQDADEGHWTYGTVLGTEASSGLSNTMRSEKPLQPSSSLNTPNPLSSAKTSTPKNPKNPQTPRSPDQNPQKPL